MSNTIAGKCELINELFNSGIINRQMVIDFFNGDVDIEKNNDRIYYWKIRKTKLTSLEQEIADLQTIGYRE